MKFNNRVHATVHQEVVWSMLSKCKEILPLNDHNDCESLLCSQYPKNFLDWDKNLITGQSLNQRFIKLDHNNKTKVENRTRSKIDH